MRNFVRKVLPECQARSPQMLGMIAVRGLEREIENEHAVVVGGDGVEPDTSNDKQARKDEFGLSSEELKKTRVDRSGIGSSSDEDNDYIPSWVKSPGWPALSHGTGPRRGVESTKSKYEIEHIEDIDIPPLSLLPPSLHPLSMPPTPTSSITTKSISKMSASSSPYSAPLPLPSISNPRRIKSTTSLSTFALQLKNQTVQESHPHDVRPRHHRKHSASSYNFSTNTFTLHHALSRPTTFKSPPRNLVMTSIQP